MIVKNEAHVVAACLESVRHLIDYWVIVDTGSVDSTEEVVRTALHGIPGEFHHHEWDGFGKSRTKALDLAKGKADYALMMDADETLKLDVWPELEADAYLLWAHPGKEVKFVTRRLFKLDLGWTYEGILHEYPKAAKLWEDKVLENAIILTTQNGARSQNPDKYRIDAIALEKALVDEPENSRYVYYLAQSWKGAGEDRLAAYRYIQRTAMGPGLNPEEVYISFLEAGRCFGRLGMLDECESALLRARQAAPTRPEAMTSLATLYQTWARATPPHGTMNVETWHYVPPAEDAE
jgi:glycosyltransferase involved in cell wall biosynthesis